MRKLRNVMLIFLIISGLFSITIGVLFNYYSGAVGGNEDVEVTIESGALGAQIGEELEKNGLIRSSSFFKLYLKLFNIQGLKAGKYTLNKEMNLGEIISLLQEGNSYNENEISLTFQEGINMRKIASIIANGTNNEEQDVYDLITNEEYLKGLIDKYWFITDSILNKDIYYSLEGYLYPDTYRFISKDVKVEDIFEKLLKKMETILTPLKEDIDKSEYNIHELLTLASIAELETRNKEDYRAKVVGVFVNRLHKKMSLGSDVTTRYSIKLDEKRALTKKEYDTVNSYNTRSSTMAGKLPAGPIAMVDESSIKAAINYYESDYLYFIANINTGETFFYAKSSDFERKKAELSSVNQGY